VAADHGDMARLLCTLLACLAASCAVALAAPGSHGPGAARAALHARHAPPALSLAAARKPIGQFLASATQVTGLPRTYRIGTCRRRDRRTLDCPIAVPGRSSGLMRAKLIGSGRAARVQLYVLRVAAA
jgi:hypothetical protein